MSDNSPRSLIAEVQAYLALGGVLSPRESDLVNALSRATTLAEGYERVIRGHDQYLRSMFSDDPNNEYVSASFNLWILMDTEGFSL